jgi:ATP-dependent RNA helicase DHX29
VCTELLEVRIGGRREENVSLDDGLLSQVAWIGQYREQQEVVSMKIYHLN